MFYKMSTLREHFKDLKNSDCTRTCAGCNEEFPLSEYGFYSIYRCKECLKEYRKKYAAIKKVKELCECGEMVSKLTMDRHKETKKHKMGSLLKINNLSIN